MADLKSFIEQARAKGVTDEHIRQALAEQGWNDARIDIALAGLEVPVAETSGVDPKQPPSHTKQQSLSPLLAALHHVLLWFFTGSSAVTIVGVVASLAGVDVSSSTLASMIAVTIVTFTPYAIMFMVFLRKARRTPGLVPGKVWSIITICLHSIGAMVAAITLVITAVTAGEWSVMVSAALILTLDLIVVVTYCFAAFASERAERVRRIVTLSYLPALGILFGILFVLSVLQFGPARHDEMLRKDLAVTVQKINTYAKDFHKLPANLTDIKTALPIEYAVKSSNTYEICAVFQTNSRDTGYMYGYDSSDQTRSDSYVNEANFETSGSGRQCFTFTSAPLEEKSTSTRPSGVEIYGLPAQ